MDQRHIPDPSSSDANIVAVKERVFDRHQPAHPNEPLTTLTKSTTATANPNKLSRTPRRVIAYPLAQTLRRSVIVEYTMSQLRPTVDRTLINGR